MGTGKKQCIHANKKDKAGTLALKSFSLSEGDRKKNVSGFENVNPIGDHSYLIEIVGGI